MKQPKPMKPSIVPYRSKRPTTRRGREARAENSPTDELLIRKAEALGVSWNRDRKGRVRIHGDMHASAEPLDALLHRRAITGAQHQAGVAFRNLYYAVWGSPHPMLPGYRALVAENVGGSAADDVSRSDPTENEEDRRARQHAAWTRAVKSVFASGGRWAFYATKEVCIHAEHVSARRVDDVRTGLSALVSHWRITV